MSEFGNTKSESYGFRKLPGEASENQNSGNSNSGNGHLGKRAWTGEATGHPNHTGEAEEIRIVGIPQASAEAPALDLNPEFDIVRQARDLLKPRIELTPNNLEIQTRHAGSQRDVGEASRREYLKIGAGFMLRESPVRSTAGGFLPGPEPDEERLS